MSWQVPDPAYQIDASLVDTSSLASTFTLTAKHKPEIGNNAGREWKHDGLKMYSQYSKYMQYFIK